MISDLILAICTFLSRERYRTYLFIVALSGSSCGDEMLIDAYDVKVLAPEVFSCSDIYPVAISEDVVLSYSSGNLLYTEDNFENVFISELVGTCGDPFSQFNYILYLDFETILVNREPDCSRYPEVGCDNPRVLISSDQGDTFTGFFDESSFPLHLHVRSRAFFASPQTGYLALFDSEVPGQLSFYRSQGQTIFRVSSFEANNKVPRLISFKNPNSGTIITQDYDHRTYGVISQNYSSYSTSDGGVSWTEEGYLGEGPIMEIIHTEEEVFAISEHQVFYKSIDGQNWSVRFETDEIIRDIDSFGEYIWLAVSTGNDRFGEIGNVYFSSNAGKSWEMSKDQIYVEYIDFASESYGVATSKQVIQTTKDGGLTWNLKAIPIHPYEGG